MDDAVHIDAIIDVSSVAKESDDDFCNYETLWHELSLARPCFRRCTADCNSTLKITDDDYDN